MKRWKPVLAAVVEIFGEDTPLCRAAVRGCMARENAGAKFLELVNDLPTRDQDRLLASMKKHVAKARLNGAEHGQPTPF